MAKVPLLLVCATAASAQDLFLQKFGKAASPTDSVPPEERAKALVKKMTLEEKELFLHGNRSSPDCQDGYVGCVPGVARLGIPPLRLQDGPEGFRMFGKHNPLEGTSTQWPSGMTTAMSWNRELMQLWGEGMGKEFADKGANVLFGPAVNLHRVPHNGRNFEYLSGEDPFLGRMLVQPIVKGIQSQGIIANVKHYIDNNQEGENSAGEGGAGDRHSTSSNVDERTQVEMYFGPYEGAVQANVLSMMCGNNLVNGVHACENSFQQNTLLREWFGFKGFMCSDYRGSQTMLGAALGGLDVQLPGCSQADPQDPSGLTCADKNGAMRPNVFGKPLLDAVKSGKVPELVLDDKVERILYAMASSGALDRGMVGDINANVTSEVHNALARRLAVESAVLLKNEAKLLPLDVAQAKRAGVVVIGAAGHDAPITGGGGSGAVVGPYQKTVLDGLRESRLGAHAVSYYGGKNTAAAAKAAQAAGFAVVVLADTSKEGLDRDTLALPDAELVAAVAAVQPNTVVVAASPGPFLAPWADDVPSVLAVFMSGQEQGSAVADIILGETSPSGKLILTIPNKDNEIGFVPEQYPGVEYNGTCTIGFSKCYNANYTEKLEVGYRWYHAKNIKPKFAFGHGLTYSTFDLSNFTVAGRTVTTTLANTGSVEAAEVVQLYVTFPESAEEPPRQLRGFEKVKLPAGAKQQISFELSDRELSIWDTNTHSWSLVAGTFSLEVGFSSADLPLKGDLVN